MTLHIQLQYLTHADREKCEIGPLMIIFIWQKWKKPSNKKYGNYSNISLFSLENKGTMCSYVLACPKSYVRNSRQ